MVNLSSLSSAVFVVASVLSSAQAKNKAIRGSRRDFHKGVIAPSAEEYRLKVAAFKSGFQGDLMVGESFDQPDYVNWVDRGFATPVKDQGNCNDCYAVSGMDMWSGRCVKDTGKLFDLSAQYALSCDIQTCQPANSEKIAQMHSFIGNSSIPTYSELNLTASVNIDPSGPLDNPPAACPAQNFPACNGNSAKVTEEWAVSNSRLRSIVSTYGPTQTMINFPSASSSSYKCGVYTEEDWPQETRGFDHAVLIVGFNYTGDDATSYWIVKNSYGSQYGFSGYFAVSMNGPEAANPTAASHYPGTMSINTLIYYIEGSVELSPNPPSEATAENPFKQGSILCNA